MKQEEANRKKREAAALTLKKASEEAARKKREAAAFHKVLATKPKTACIYMAKKFAVVPQKSWGKLPNEFKFTWNALKCNPLVKEFYRPKCWARLPNGCKRHLA